VIVTSTVWGAVAESYIVVMKKSVRTAVLGGTVDHIYPSINGYAATMRSARPNGSQRSVQCQFPTHRKALLRQL
jgi:hypothetical protein